MELKNIFDLIYSEPTAPFHEYRIEKVIMNYCFRNNIPYHRDDLGMLWVNKSKDETIIDTDLLLVSHLDHPGVEFERNNKAKWLGGEPPKLKNTTFRIFNENRIGYGKVISYENNDSILIDSPFLAKAGCLYFPELPLNYKITDHHLYTSAADDLIIVSALLKAVTYNSNLKILLTRAEEFNLTGITKLLAKNRLDKKRTSILVLDTTHQTFNINIGAGIVVRLGDSETYFDLKFTKEIEKKIKDLGLKYINHRLYYGTTEGTAFVKHGFRVASLAIAVKNQHNKDAYNNPVPEEVDLRDVEELVKFLQQL